MKNADMPAMPTHDVFEHCGFDGNSGPYMTQTTNYGLTKREMMAVSLPDMELSMKPQCASELIGRDVDWADVRDAIKASAEIEAIQRVIRADALLAELERTCQKT